MAKRVAAAAAADAESEGGAVINIRRATIQQAVIWITGTAPLITHSWSEKAKREMLGKQQKRVTGGKAVRDPQADFQSSLYEMAEGVYGFPATGLKKAFLTPAHKDRGVARTSVLTSLWIQPELVRVRPALAGAICDMPLIRIVAGEPEMREDMVKVGSGLAKTATLAYRAQFFLLVGNACAREAQCRRAHARHARHADQRGRHVMRHRRVAQREERRLRRVPVGERGGSGGMGEVPHRRGTDPHPAG